MQRPGSTRLRLTAAPSASVVSLAEAKAHLNVTFDQDDAQITAGIAAAEGCLDGAKGSLGRALVTQAWALELDGFPFDDGVARPIEIPLSPLIAVQSVSYVDESGATAVLSPDAYLVHGGEYGMVEPAPGARWPATDGRLRAVTVAFTAGYGAPAAVPAPIRSAILLMAGDLYANREASVIEAGKTSVVENPTVQLLLRNFRDWGA